MTDDGHTPCIDMPRALIAEDEPLLARALARELAKAWPDLALAATAQDGDEAVALALVHRPEVVFLDIRMPGRSGLEAARAIAEDWPADGTPLPLVVFVTAYDQYAVQAFERAAADYLQKPVQPARLAACCDRLRAALAQREAASSRAAQEAALVARLRGLLDAGALADGAAAATGEPLAVLQASVGNTVHLVPLDEVLYLEAADKYVRVVTAERELLIRTSLREILPRLPAQRFWQIHRATVVRAAAVASATRDDAGKVTLALRGRDERLAVSRLYAHLFRGM